MIVYKLVTVAFGLVAITPNLMKLWMKDGGGDK